MIKKLIIIVLFLSICSTSYAQTWQQVAKRTQAQKTAGLSGGEGWQQTPGMAFAPSNSNIAYLVSDTNQVWKTTNANADPYSVKWERKANGFYANGGVSIVVDPTNPDIVYVAGSEMEASSSAPISQQHDAEGIFRTTDGGDNWTRVADVHFHRKYAQGGIHFAFAGSNIYAAQSEGGLLKSTDGGTKWNLVNKSGGGYVLDAHGGLYDIKVHPTDNTKLFVSTGLGLYRVSDSGGSATVTKIGTSWSNPYRSPTSTVYSTVINYNDPTIIYATAGTGGIYKSIDGGINFNQTKASPVSQGTTGSARQIAMSPVNPNKVMVGFLYLWPTKQLYYTHDGGTNWTLTQTMDEKNADGWVAGSLFSGGWTQDFSGSGEWSAPVAFHPTIENTAIMAGHGDIVRKTTDGGKTWKYANTGYTGAGGLATNPSLFGWDSANPNTSATMHSDFGPMLTIDGEDTFKSIGTLDPSSSAGGTIKGNVIVISHGRWTGDAANQYKVSVSRNSGASFAAISGTEGGVNDWVNTLVRFHPQNDNIVYAGKYRFDNIGTSNAYVTIGSSKNVYGTFPGNGDIVYTWGKDGTTGNWYIQNSTNKGGTWSATNLYPSIPVKSTNTAGIKQIAIDPTNQNRIYVAVRSEGIYIVTDTSANGGEVIYRGDANGITKSRYGYEDINSVAVDPNNPNVVYAAAYASWYGHSNGVFRSTDYGMTWTNINGNLGADMNIKGVAVNPHNSYVYIASHAGTWKLPPPGESPGTSTPGGGSPLVTTGTTTSVTITTATLNGVVNPNNLQTTYSWQYGTSPATYTLATGSQTLSAGTSSIDVSTGITSLAGSTTYYTRIRAANGSGTTNGSETSFSTLSILSYAVSQTTSVVVDGYLTEYGTYTAISKVIDGAPVSTGSWSACWTPGTSGGLYIGVSVLDSNLYGDTGSTTPYQDDAIDIYIDRDFNKGSSYDVYDRQFVNAYNSSFIYSKNTAGGTNTGVVVARAITAGGYNSEWFVPVSNFSGGSAFGTGITIGFDVQLDDDNNGGNREGAKGWNNSANNNYLSTANFGEITFLGTTTEGGGGGGGSDPSMPIDTGSGTLSYLPGMVFYARLDEGTGTIINDVTGNCPPGSITGATWVTGTSGTALQFDGIDDFVNIGTPTALSIGGTNNYTLLADVIRGTSTDTNLHILGKMHIGGASRQWALFGYGSIAKSYKSTDGRGSNIYIAPGTSTLSTTAWSNLCTRFTYGSSLEIIVNNVLEGITSTFSDATYNGTASVTMGMTQDSTYKFIGTVDNPRIFNRAITDGEKADIQKWPVVTNGTATPIYGTWATVYGTCTPYGTTTHAYVRYGTQSGNYTVTTLETYIGTNSTATGFNRTLGTLTAETTYYYQNIAYNPTGNMVYGIEQSFTTTSGTSVDTESPVGTVTINSGATYNTDPSVTLSLSATDDIGIEGYYISAGTTTPEISAEGWVNFGTVTPYSANIPYTFAAGDGTRTVYAWYKDGVGSVSAMAQDSIIQDITPPFIEITTPTYNCTFGNYQTLAKGTTSSTITFAGIASDLHDIASVSWSNSATSTTGVFAGTATFSGTLNIVPATANTITLSALGNDGNTGQQIMVIGAIPEIASNVSASITISGALLKGTVSANNGTTTVWWNYGLDSGYYTGTTSTYELTGGTPTTVSVPLANLPNMKTYYFRMGSTNALGTTYSYESSFDLALPDSKGFLNW